MPKRRRRWSKRGKIQLLSLFVVAVGGYVLFTSRPAQAPHHPRPPHTTRTRLPWRSSRLNQVLPGDVLIADSYNHRILIVNAQKRIVWQFPQPGHRPNHPFARPDDAFFGPHFDEIVTNEEDYQVVSIINLRQRRIVWQYGHFGKAGSDHGYLDYPDDAFLYWRNGHGLIAVADIRNDRILTINRATHQIVRQYGQTRVDVANPPVSYAAPNGDFPAPHGGMLVTQIGGQDVVRLNHQGHVLWKLRLPYFYPSDANLTPHGNVIVAFYTNPGRIIKISRGGKILWQYHFASGPRALNKPSLAMQLPNGNILATDDHNDRVVVINPKTKRIVWQYGHRGVPGKAPGYLNVPDGADWLPAGITPGAKNPVGHHLWSYPGNGY